MTGPNPPWRHHFLPECYQRLWVGADGKLERFAPEHQGSLRVRRVAPAAADWSPDFYRVPGEEESRKAQKVETDFFAPLDGAAAKVMQRMCETRQPPSTGGERTVWAQFVLSFLHRTPEHMNATLEALVEMNAELMPEVEQRHAELRGERDPPTFAQWEAQRAEHAIARSSLRTIMDQISNPGFGTFLINLHWAVIDLSPASLTLVASDNPVILVPLKTDDGHLALPLGPRRLFMASQHRPLIDAVRRQKSERTVRTVNRLLVERAGSLVIAADRSQDAFVLKHFGTCRIGSLATGLNQPPRLA